MKTTRILIADPCPILRQALATLVREQGPGWQVCVYAIKQAIELLGFVDVKEGSLEEFAS